MLYCRHNKKGADTLKKILVLDTETAGGFAAPLAYDVGGVVMDNTGFIHHRFHYAVLDIIGNPHIMDTAYYAEKMPIYWVNVQEHETSVIPFGEVLRKLTAIIDLYEIDTIAAYNFNFDNRALAATCEYLYENRKWLNREVAFACIWAGACDSIMNTQKYSRWAKKNGFISEKGNPQTSAEVCFRYITGDTAFIEDHTGKNDAEIEAHILANILRRKKKTDFTPCASPWRKVAKTYKEVFGG